MYSEQDTQARRERERGQSVSEVLGYPKTLLVMRAMVGDDPAIQPMDYMFVSMRPLRPGAAERVISALEEGDELTNREERLLLKAVEHACTVAMYKGEPCHVMAASVSSNDVYEATNPGEYFYDGKKPLRGSLLVVADENGFVKKPEEEVKFEPR